MPPATSVEYVSVQRVPKTMIDEEVVASQKSHEVGFVIVHGGDGPILVDYEPLSLRLCDGGIRGLVLILRDGVQMWRAGKQVDWTSRDRYEISREV